MSMNFVIPHVYESLGQSVIYEECKGDFNLARRIADAGLAEARLANSPVHLADALLASGMVHLLQGETLAALARFQEIEPIVPGDSSHRVRADSYAYLATKVQFTYSPQGGSPSEFEVSRRWSALDYMVQQAKERQGREELLRKLGDPALELETQFIVFLTDMFSLRSTTPSLSTQEIIHQYLRNTMSELLPFALRDREQARQNVPALLAYSDLLLADLHRRAGQGERAVQFINQALNTYLAVFDVTGAGLCHMISGDWSVAPNSNPIAWNYTLSHIGPDTPLEATEFDRSGFDVAVALAAYEKAQHLFQAAGARRGLAALQLRYGYLATLAANYEKAAAHATAAQSIFDEVGDQLGGLVARAHHILCLVGLGQWSGEMEQDAIAIGQWGRTQGSFSFCLTLGHLFTRAGRHWLVREGDYERALTCSRLATTLFRTLDATTNIAQSLVNEGNIYKQIGDETRALVTYERAMDLYSDIMQRYPRFAAMASAARVELATQIYVLQHEPAGMEREAARLEGLLAQPDPKPIVYDTATSQQEGRLVGARVAASATLGAARFMVPLLRGKEAQDAGDTVLAQQHFEKARVAAQQLDGPNAALWEASVLIYQGDYAEAVETLHHYLSSDWESTLDTFFGIPNVGLVSTTDPSMEADAQKLNDAWMWEMQLLKRREKVGKLSQVIHYLIKCKDYTTAQQQLEQIEAVAGAMWWIGEERPWQPLMYYGRVAEGLEKLPEAQRHYEEAITLLERRRMALRQEALKLALVGHYSVPSLYFSAIGVALKLREAAQQAGADTQARAYAAQAFTYAERSRARTLLDLMSASSPFAHGSRVESSTIQQWRRTTTRLSAWQGIVAQERSKSQPDELLVGLLKEQIAEAEATLRVQEAELAHSDPHFYRTLNPQAQIMDFNALCGLLQPGDALLQYAFLGTDFLAWALTSQGMELVYHTSIDEAALDRQIRAFHQACEQQGKVEELGHGLAELLLLPLGEVIRKSSHLTIIPYGPAQRLPFHALPWQGQPLGASHTISYLPSASTLQFLRRSPLSRPHHLLSVGNPARMTYQPPFREPRAVTSLPASETEAHYVASLFSESMALVGEAATKEKVLRELGNASILHFATHGYLEQEVPLLSAILLANGESLTLYDLMSLRLSAELVVLSACRTGQGALAGGDEVLGLTRGLLGSGAQVAVVTLWAVDDLSTSLLMGEFYRRLREGDLPALALQRAQHYLRTLTPEAAWQEIVRLLPAFDGNTDSRDAHRRGMRETTGDYSHPFYWAPFILVG